MDLERFSVPVHVCSDPGCPYAGLSDAEHFDRHNPRCAQLFVGRGGEECLCELAEGHEGPHRGQVHRLSPSPTQSDPDL